MYCNPSLNCVLFGAPKPGSRPHHWQLTTVPGTVSEASGVPPSPPTANRFMSIEGTPEQSFGGGLPPVVVPGVRLMGALTHKVPPWNAPAAGPLVP